MCLDRVLVGRHLLQNRATQHSKQNEREAGTKMCIFVLKDYGHLIFYAMYKYCKICYE